ncbi:hypothetical protein C8R44DRAFT_896082 [Mycena epipterygia]|nr:hypothetical protein C8R44DRAFT_896082 [Mycena epipterygia]
MVLRRSGFVLLIMIRSFTSMLWCRDDSATQRVRAADHGLILLADCEVVVGYDSAVLAFTSGSATQQVVGRAPLMRDLHPGPVAGWWFETKERSQS